MAKIFIGEEKKFAIDLQAQGFSMDDDDFEIEVATVKGSVKGNKGNDTGTNDLRIFREPALSDSSSSSSSSEEEQGTWYGIIDTSKLPYAPGEVRVIGTAFVKDSNANDGVRKEIAVATLGTLANPYNM